MSKIRPAIIVDVVDNDLSSLLAIRILLRCPFFCNKLWPTKIAESLLKKFNYGNTEESGGAIQLS